MTNVLTSVPANGQQQIVWGQTGSPAPNIAAIIPLMGLVGPDGVTPISSTNRLPVDAAVDNLPAAAAIADGAANPTTAAVDARLSGYNGSTWDRQYNNTQGTLLASAARTASVNAPNMTNYNSRGVIVTLSVSVASGTGGLTVIIQGYDPAGGVNHYLLVAPAAIIATGLATYIIYPGASGSDGNVKHVVGAPLPRQWTVTVSHGDASSYTYSLGYALIK